ncbi:hypothetical protein [Streptomyces sp. NPDC087512]|uniref:hypothetical protein n=1 Tax=unclassified Streptomyces TaxID=2593676 RepID=UPI0034452D21
MGLIVLSGILVLAVGGCVCVVWAARGGPPWTRGVAKTTLLAGELVRAAGRSGGKPNRGGAGGTDD